jgi:hypothetical protein
MARSEVARSEEYNAGRGISVSLGFQRLLQFFAPLTQRLLSYQPATAHSDCRQVFVPNRIIEEAKR